MIEIETEGKFLRDTLDSLGLHDDARVKTIASSQSIVEKVITSYNTVAGQGHVGKNGTGIPANLSIRKTGAIGLVYGRIQSGKTRAMIVSTAMAFDNGFRVAVVVTSNINDLVTQTHLDFTKELRGVSVFTKDDELAKHVNDAKLDMEDEDGRILVVASKGAKSLKNITDFLKAIGAKKVPMVIFDDEGDQASLDTNTYKRSSSGNLTLEPSSINKLIGKLRKEMPASVYVSVTGTPQAVLLQSASSDNRPSFVNMLSYGDNYVGGDYFFDTDEPLENKYNLVSIIPSEDKSRLLDSRHPIPTGLRDSILFFLLSASAVVRNVGFPEKGKDKGYQFLCHPSLKNNEQTHARDRISNFLTQVKAVLMGRVDNSGIAEALQAQYEELKKQLGEKTPSLDDLKTTIKQELVRKKILVINASTKRKGIEYGPGFNFLIGGNTLGRGIAIPNLLVTYYVRHAQTSQIDTMHQHARMFGYRMATLPYTRLFITKNLYSRFRDIHYSDKGLRAFIEKHINTLPEAFPVEFSTGLRATRRGVLDANTTETVWPGMQVYPNYIKLPQPGKIFKSVLSKVATHFKVAPTDMKAMREKGKDGVLITIDEAIEIISPIKTKSQNSWHDKTIATVIKKLSQRLGDKIKLRFRPAERTIDEGGFLSTGTLGGYELDAARAETIPTLWIMAVTAKPDSKSAPNSSFIFPTLVVPNNLPNIFVFSKK